jgi:hypothetical protein
MNALLTPGKTIVNAGVRTDDRSGNGFLTIPRCAAMVKAMAGDRRQVLPQPPGDSF